MIDTDNGEHTMDLLAIQIPMNTCQQTNLEFDGPKPLLRTRSKVASDQWHDITEIVAKSPH